jgi:hypothetical protein
MKDTEAEAGKSMKRFNRPAKKEKHSRDRIDEKEDGSGHKTNQNIESKMNDDQKEDIIKMLSLYVYLT